LGATDFNAIKAAASLTFAMQQQILAALNEMKNDTLLYLNNQDSVDVNGNPALLDQYEVFTWRGKFLPVFTTVDGTLRLRSMLTQAEYDTLWPSPPAWAVYDKGKKLSDRDYASLKWYHISILEETALPGLVERKRVWHTYKRTVTRYDDRESGGTYDETMLYRVILYATQAVQDDPQALKSLPLLANVHSWASGYQVQEGQGGYEKNGIPYVMVAFALWDPTKRDTLSDGRNTSTWYWGNVWTDGSGKKTSVPWYHNAVVQVLKEIKEDSSIIYNAVGATIDTNRIYLWGNSIGGTATLQIGIKHPEIFAAIRGVAGWTRYYNTNFDNSYQYMVGNASTDVFIKGNADQLHIPLSNTEYNAKDYTDLAWWLTTYRNPGWPTPFAFFGDGINDDIQGQGDHLQPAMESQKRGYYYDRADAGHGGDDPYIHMNWLVNFRRDQSFLAFTNRSYGLNSLTAVGEMNDLQIHGWDPSTIVDQADYYEVTLTGTGTADVTIRRIQNLKHGPGSLYNLTIDGTPTGEVTADANGLITINQVADDATIGLECTRCIDNTTPTRPDDVPVAVGPVVKVGPNPFSTSVEIKCSMRNADCGVTNINVCIYDISGKKVAQLLPFRIPHSALGIRHTWSPKTSPNGIYFVNITIGNKTVTKRITLVK
jgi:pimeloyl-ACP methyl ester carboxylesterase